MADRIAYIKASTLFSKHEELAEKGLLDSLLKTLGESCIGTLITVGSAVDLARVVGYKLRGDELGLVIEWVEGISLSTLIEGAHHG